MSQTAPVDSNNVNNDLLNLLFAQVKVPDFQCRFKWAPNSIAFWDNRATQHYAASDYFPHRRVMERVEPNTLVNRNRVPCGLAQVSCARTHEPASAKSTHEPVLSDS